MDRRTSYSHIDSAVDDDQEYNTLCGNRRLLLTGNTHISLTQSCKYNYK